MDQINREDILNSTVQSVEVKVPHRLAAPLFHGMCSEIYPEYAHLHPADDGVILHATLDGADILMDCLIDDTFTELRELIWKSWREVMNGKST